VRDFGYINCIPFLESSQHEDRSFSKSSKFSTIHHEHCSPNYLYLPSSSPKDQGFNTQTAVLKTAPYVQGSARSRRLYMRLQQEHASSHRIGLRSRILSRKCQVSSHDYLGSATAYCFWRSNSLDDSGSEYNTSGSHLHSAQHPPLFAAPVLVKSARAVQQKLQKSCEVS
jgi:hypothetical protein